LGPIPNPQSPIPNPQSPKLFLIKIFIFKIYIYILIEKNKINNINLDYKY